MTIRTVGASPNAEGVISLADSESWEGPPALQVPNGRRPLDVAAIFFGDEESGPVLFLFATPPGVSLPASEAHGHASDTWRMPLKGSFKMGRTEYGPGDARFQRGWRTYPSDNFASGAQGGWLALLFADRRGTRVQRPGTNGAAPGVAEQAVAEWIGLPDHDVEREQQVPRSQLSTPAGDGSRTGHVNVSFEESLSWGVAPGERRFIGHVGSATGGPGVVMSTARPGTCVDGIGIASDTVGIVVRGSASVDAHEYTAGQVRIRRPGVPTALRAGPNGFAHVLIAAETSS